MKNEIILTNMCMLYKDDGSFLVINRLKNDWPGISFPGGHVEFDEDISSSVIREMKEETGLDVKTVKFISYYEWNIPKERKRHLCLLFRSKDFVGEIKSSDEGEVFFMKKEDLGKYPLSTDFDKILELAFQNIK